MESLTISAGDYQLNSETDSFIKIKVENALEYDLLNANFFISIHETVWLIRRTHFIFFLKTIEQRYQQEKS